MRDVASAQIDAAARQQRVGAVLRRACGRWAAGFGGQADEEITQAMLRTADTSRTCLQLAVALLTAAPVEADARRRNRTYLTCWQRAALDDCDHGLPHRRGAVPD